MSKKAQLERNRNSLVATEAELGRMEQAAETNHVALRIGRARAMTRAAAQELDLAMGTMVDTPTEQNL